MLRIALGARVELQDAITGSLHEVPPFTCLTRRESRQDTGVGKKIGSEDCAPKTPITLSSDRLRNVIGMPRSRLGALPDQHADARTVFVEGLHILAGDFNR